MRITNRSVILRALLAALALILALAPISGAAAATMDEELSTADVEATEAPAVTEPVATEAPAEVPVEEPAVAPEPVAPEPEVTEPVEEAPAPAEEPEEEVVAPDDAGPAPPVEEPVEPAAAATEEVVAPEDELQAADAPNPLVMSGSQTMNADGTVTLTLSGNWEWNRICGDRIVGWAIDWDDPNNPGWPVATAPDGRLIDVGTPTDNTVHHVGYSNCTTGSKSGTWGPISHTYAATVAEARPCVVLYDHVEGQPTGGHGLIAGGPDRNTDNSLEKNMFSANNDCVPTTFVLRNPRIDIAKSGTPTTNVTVGQTVNYTLTVTNPGNQVLSNVRVTDPKCDATPVRTGGDANSDNLLQLSETWTYTCSRVTRAADVPSLENTATAIGTPPTGSDVSDTATFTIPVAAAPNPQININKTGPASGVVGTSVTYVMEVTNPGNQNLTNVVVADPKCDTGTLAGPLKITGNADDTLSNGEMWRYTCTRVLQAADIGTFKNTSTATGTPPTGSNVSDTDDHDVVVTAAPNALINIDKTGPGTGVVGSTITYTMVVTNPGNQNLTNVVVSDPRCDTGTLSAPIRTGGNTDATLSPGETWTYTCTRVLQAGDAPSLVNTATATGTPPTGTPVTDTDTHTVTVTAAPVFNVTISKDPDPQTVSRGGTATWVITVTNTSTGNGSLTNVRVTDALAPDCDEVIGTLPAGNSRSYTCTLTNVRSSFTNVAVVHTDQLADRQDTAAVTVRTVTDSDDPSIALVKTAAVDAGPHSPGDLVRYSFTVTNNGDVTLSNVTLNDPRVGGAVALSTTTLAPGASTTATATYALTQADIDDGQVPNTATTTGRTSGGQTVTANASALALLEQDPGLDLDKSGPATAALGETITYTFTVTNSGNVTMRNVTITDSMLGLVDLAVSPSTLAPGASGTATATYTVTEADVEAGRIINTALAKGRTPDDTEIDDEDDHRTDIPDIPEAPEPGLALEKSGPAIARVGDTVTYTFTATNTGEVTLSNVTVTDPLLGLDRLTVRPSTLAPGEEGTATATYVITQADADAGSVYNTAVLRGRTPDGTTVRDRDDHTVDVPLVPPAVPPAVPPRQLPPPELPATGLGSTGFALTALLSLALGGVLLGIAGTGNLQTAMANATVNADSPMLAVLRRWNLAPKPGGSQARRRRHRAVA